MFSAISGSISLGLNKITIPKKRIPDPKDKQREALRSSIEHTKANLAYAIENFNNVTEPKLVDFYIYRIQSEQTRFEQLLAEYKALEDID
ncbi:MAG: DUF2508 family protein [Clostridia bacterium]|nr:DUF2508 family protein [Clostridia bacterium]